MADVTPPERRAQNFGLLGAAFGLGLVLGPAVGGFLGQIDLRLPFFNQAQVLREFELIIAGKKAFSWQVWRWINFCRWYGHFIA